MLMRILLAAAAVLLLLLAAELLQSHPNLAYVMLTGERF